MIKIYQKLNLKNLRETIKKKYFNQLPIKPLQTIEKSTQFANALNRDHARHQNKKKEAERTI